MEWLSDQRPEEPKPVSKEFRNDSGEIRISDEALLARYEAGDPKAFEELYRRHRQPLFRFILRFLRNETDSQDALQDLFLKIIRDPTRFKARSRFSTWLHAVAKNLCIDLIRKRKRRMALMAASARDEPLVERRPSQEPSPEDRAHGNSLRIKLLVAIQAIPAEQKTVFLMRELGGFSFNEIAELTGVGANTAKSRMHYAIGHLRKVVDPSLFTLNEPK